MKKHRGLFLALGLCALLGLTAREASAGTLTLTVYEGTGTSGTVIGSAIGIEKSVNLTNINSDLSSHGYSAYSFGTQGLTGQSNNSNPSGDAFVLLSGNMTVSTTGTGAGKAITIVLTEGGFNTPSGSKGGTLTTTDSSNYATVSTSTQTGYSTFSDSSSPPVTATTPTVNNSSGSSTMSSSVGVSPYVTPFTLTTIVTVALTTTNSTGGGDALTGKAILAGSVPEPASMVMLMTGMPLPLVVMGLLRRRRRNAA